MEEQIKRTNPLLERAVIPGETFRLPSQGLFYNNGELSPDVSNGEIHIRAMTAVDELVFKSPDMLFTGKAVEEVFARCVPQVIKPRQLLSKDVDFIIMCLRLVTYGPSISLAYTHDCQAIGPDSSSIVPKEHTYEVMIQPIVQRAKQIDPTTITTNFTVTLPNNQVVKLKPVTYDTMVALSQDMDLASKTPSLEDLKTSVMTVIVDAIDSVDGVSDKEMIAEWVDQLSAGWIRQITDSFNMTSDWGTENVVREKCRDCGADIELEFSINPISFFS